MKSSRQIEKIVESARAGAGRVTDEQILTDAGDALAEFSHNKSQSVRPGLAVWRFIMKSRMTKFATAGIIVLTLVGINLLKSNPAWAIEQTVRALKNIQTVTITGTTIYYDSNNIPEYKPFKCWVKLNDKNGNLLMRVESPREIAVVQGDKVYFNRPGSNHVRILEGETIHNLKFWYKAMELSPWLSGKMIQTLRPLADDWQEEYGSHRKTGRDCVFVKCSYEQLSASFWFVFDIESKLIIEARHWSNPSYKNPVNSYADSFVYNEEIPDETFQFEIPEGAKVIYQKDVDRDEELTKRSTELFDRAEQLFHKEGKYAEAIEIYQQVYETYPELNIAEEALTMIGICYDWLGQPEKAIEAYEKAVSEYSDLKGWIESTYFYLGCAYMDTGQKEKALDAFEKCLAAGQGVRKPDQFPLKDARECIAKIKAEQNNQSSQ
jgi:tetratricopeptide (TPR) repeat protein